MTELFSDQVSGCEVSVEEDLSADCSKTLYFGNLHPYVTQKSLEDLCLYFGENSSKVIKDKSTGTSAGYGFVRFSERKCAEAALQALNGKGYLGHELRVNWALPTNHKESDTSAHNHIFVGDLGADVTDAMLYNSFCVVGQCSDARVMWDHSTGRSKGYGFVSFRAREDAEIALERMQGKQIGSRKVRCGWAQHKQEDNPVTPAYEAVDRSDPSNTNVYVGNILPEWTEVELTNHFSVYGPVVEVKLHKKGGYGFVKFELHESAVKAIVDKHGKDLSGRVLKCSWGKNIVAPAPPPPSMTSAASVLGHISGSTVAGGLPVNMVPSMVHNHHHHQLMAQPTSMQSLMAAANSMGVLQHQQSALGGGHMHSAAGLSQVFPMATLQMMMMHGMQGLGQVNDCPTGGMLGCPSLSQLSAMTQVAMDTHNMYGQWPHMSPMYYGQS